MRLHLISYVDPHGGGLGGGEAIVRELLAAGRARGHEISRTHVLPRPVFEPPGRPDLVLLVDVWNVPGHRRRLHRRVMRRLPGSALWRYDRRVRWASGRRYVHLDNAYVDLCDLPYLPCNGEARGPLCPHKTGRDRRCFAGRTRRLYEDAAHLIFLSPLHQRTVLARLEDEGLAERASICRPLIDPQPFRAAAARATTRPIDRLYLGPLTEAKGLDEMRDRLGLGTIHAVGRPPASLDRADAEALASLRPPVAREQVPELLASARALVMLPRWPEPQGRVALEAVLAGCELIGNDRLGALTFDQDPADDALYAGAADEVWQRLEGLAAS